MILTPDRSVLLCKKHNDLGERNLQDRRSLAQQPAAKACSGDKGGLPPISASLIHFKISASPKGNWLAVPLFSGESGMGAACVSKRFPLARDQPLLADTPL